MTDPLTLVLEYVWPELKGADAQTFANFLKSHQEDWNDIYGYDESYKSLVRNKIISLHGHTGAPTPVMRKHAAYYGLRWAGNVAKR